MRIPGVKTTKTFSRWLHARILGGAMILGYHRIGTAVTDEYEVCISPEHFDEQMDVVSRYARPVSLSTLVQHLRNGSVPTRSVAVTFDDGYADNLIQAKPILEKYGIPATVFVCTGYSGQEFWWDELGRLVTGADAEPQSLKLQMGKGLFRWDPPGIVPEAAAGKNATKRNALINALYQILLPMDVEERERSMEVIRSWAGLAAEISPAHRAMSQTELLQLAESGLIELGSHTRSHPILPQLSLQRQTEEIESSKRDLETLLGKAITGFSYPNGQATQDTKRIARAAGYTYACTSLHDVVRPGDDLFELTRFWQGDVNGDHFLRKLKLWMR